MQKIGLRDFMQAGYPCLFLQTVEPEVSQKAVLDILKEEARKDPEVGRMLFGSWKVTSGLYLTNVESSLPVQVRPMGVLEVLNMVQTSVEPVCAVLHHIRTQLDNVSVVQSLIDATYAARLSKNDSGLGSHIILVGAHLELPPELRSIVTIVDQPLPTKEEIADLFSDIVEAYRDTLKGIPKGKAFEALLREAAIAAVGLDRMGAENALALSLACVGRIDPKIIQRQKDEVIKSSDVLEFVDSDVSMNQVGGFGELKSWLSRRAKAFSEEAQKFGISYPKGILVAGPPGTGKSQISKAVANLLNLRLLKLDFGKIHRMWHGESEASIRNTLKTADAAAPVVLWCDELDRGLAGTKSSGELDSGVTGRVVGTLLNWMQERTSAVFLVATANEVRSLPGSVIRRGRFDEIFVTDLPTEEERQEIFEIHLRKRRRDPENFDVPLLALRSDRFVGSEIEGVVEDALFVAFDEGKEVATGHILAAIQETIPQADRDAEDIQALREWAKGRARSVSGAGKKEAERESKTKVRSLRGKNT